MSSKISPFGKVEVTVAASAKISAHSKSPYTIKYKVGYPNQPDSWKLLKAGVANEEYSSSAFSAATVVRLEAGSSELIYNQGTDAVPPEKRNALNQPAPVALNATGALTAAAILSGIVTSTTAAAVAGTVPTGAVLDAAIELAIGEAIDFSVIATGANAFTVTAADGVTIVGTAAVSTATSGRFRLRKTAAATYIIYRLA